MASDNGEHGQSGQGEQSQSWPPPQQHEWGQQERSDEPDEATVARPVPPPPPNFDNARPDADAAAAHVSASRSGRAVPAGGTAGVRLADLPAESTSNPASAAVCAPISTWLPGLSAA